jgi:hypothetical protein
MVNIVSFGGHTSSEEAIQLGSGGIETAVCE